MLYGYHETVDDRCATIVAAADTVSEYDDWIASLSPPYEHLVEFTASTLMDHMYRDGFKGYKRSVLIVYHTDERQRNQFLELWKILLVHSQAARDRQKDMIWLKNREEEIARQEKEDAEAREKGQAVSGRTIEEIYGLVDHDPWDRRSPEQIAEDERIKDQMKDLQKKGDISGDSFGGAKEQREARAAERGEKGKPEDTAHVTDIRTNTNSDGTISIDNVLARKQGGDVDTELAESKKNENEQNERNKKAGRRSFSPEDYAAVLAGDGSADHLNIPAHPDSDKRRREPASKELNLSPEAQEARRKYQEEQQVLADVKAAAERIELDKIAIEDHKKGIFKGSDLFPDQSIDKTSLPDSIKEILEAANIKSEKIPLKDYPYNSLLGDYILFPHDGRLTPNAVILTKIENLEVVGMISMDEPAVTVTRKIDTSLPAWAAYRRPRKQDKPDSDVDHWDVFVVRVR